MAKIRLQEAVCEKEDLSNELSPNNEGNLELILENEYAWLTVNNVAELDHTSEINSWLLRAIELLQKLDLLNDHTCHLCGETGTTMLIYNGTRDVARICNKCHTERIRIQKEEEAT